MVKYEEYRGWAKVRVGEGTRSKEGKMSRKGGKWDVKKESLGVKRSKKE